MGRPHPAGNLRLAPEAGHAAGKVPPLRREPEAEDRGLEAGVLVMEGLLGHQIAKGGLEAGRGHRFAREDRTDLSGTYLCESYLRDFVNFILNLELIYILLFIFEKYF